MIWDILIWRLAHVRFMSLQIRPSDTWLLHHLSIRGVTRASHTCVLHNMVNSWRNPSLPHMGVASSVTSWRNPTLPNMCVPSSVNSWRNPSLPHIVLHYQSILGVIQVSQRLWVALLTSSFSIPAVVLATFWCMSLNPTSQAFHNITHIQVGSFKF